jgi:hypothetical protein
MPIIDTRAVTLHDPSTLPLSFVGLELVVLGLAALTFAHARRAHRDGDRRALFTWITIIVYGLAMEVISYNTVDNFKHGQFTVMFYDRQLPLYVTAVYPVLLYTGIATARCLGLRSAVEPLAAGLLIVAMDAPFDLVGPLAGWWRWLDGHTEIAHRWAGVPVTSFFWHFAFGAILAALTSWVAGRSRRPRGPAPWLALPVTVAVIVLGIVAFLPFHGAVAIGVSGGLFVGAALAAAAVAAIVAGVAGRVRPGFDLRLAALWIVFYGYHGAVALALATADLA